MVLHGPASFFFPLSRNVSTAWFSLLAQFQFLALANVVFLWLTWWPMSSTSTHLWSRAAFSSEPDQPSELNTWSMILDLSFSYKIGTVSGTAGAGTERRPFRALASSRCSWRQHASRWYGRSARLQRDHDGGLRWTSHLKLRALTTGVPARRRGLSHSDSQAATRSTFVTDPKRDF